MLIFFLLGAVLASFVGVVAERVDTGQSWLAGRSRCDVCATSLSARDLLPVISWIVAGGKCRSCGSRIPIQHVVAEAVLGVLFALAYLHLGLSLSLPVFLFVLTVLAFIVLYDLRHTLVPSGASALILIGSATFLFLQGGDPVFNIIVAVLIGLGFFSMWFFSGGRAMGLGDAPIAFALALLVGTQALPGLLFSFWSGALFGICVLVFRRGGPRMGIEVPFVPFLAFGFLLAYFTGWNPIPLFP